MSAQRNTVPLLVDSGNALFKSVQVETGDTIETITARGVAEIYSLMHFSAVAVGPFDLSAGTAFLQETTQTGIQWISANLYGRDGSLLFESFKTVEHDGLRIALVGLTAAASPPDSSYLVTDGSEELGRLLPELAVSHDLVVILTNISHKQALRLAQLNPEVDIIFGADRRKANIPPLLMKNTVITQTASQGKYLGMLAVGWTGGPWQENGSDGLDLLNKRLQSIDWQLNRLSAEPDKTSKRYMKRKSVLEREKQTILEEISRLEKKTASGGDTVLSSSYEFSIIPLKPSISEDRKINAVVNSVKEKINRYRTSHQQSPPKQ